MCLRRVLRHVGEDLGENGLRLVQRLVLILGLGMALILKPRIVVCLVKNVFLGLRDLRHRLRRCVSKLLEPAVVRVGRHRHKVWLRLRLVEGAVSQVLLTRLRLPLHHLHFEFGLN